MKFRRGQRVRIVAPEYSYLGDDFYGTIVKVNKKYALPYEVRAVYGDRTYYLWMDSNELEFVPGIVRVLLRNIFDKLLTWFQEVFL